MEKVSDEDSRVCMIEIGRGIMCGGPTSVEEHKAICSSPVGKNRPTVLLVEIESSVRCRRV